MKQTIRQFPKLPITIDYDEEDLEETIQERIFEKINGDDPEMVVLLRWEGHSEKYLSGKEGSHRSHFFVEFDIACCFIDQLSQLPILVGYELKWMQHGAPPFIHDGEGQVSWLLEQDASYAYLIRPKPVESKAKQDIPALVEHLQAKRCVGLYFIDVDKNDNGKLRLDEALRPNYHNNKVKLDRLRFNLFLAYNDVEIGKLGTKIRPKKMPTWVEHELNRIVDETYIERYNKIRKTTGP